MEIKQLQDAIQAGKISIVKTGVDRGKPKPKQMLLLVNYKPIVRYIGSTCQYAFLDIISMKVTFKSKAVARSINADTIRHWCGISEDLASIVKDWEDHPEFTMISNLIENTLNLDDFQYDGMSYEGDIPELEAVLLKTSSFKLIEAIIASDVNNNFTLNGVNFPNMVQAKRTSQSVPVSVVFRQWYYGHMAEANVELTAAYWKTLGKPKDPYMLRFKILDEFVPFTIKFEGIFNPFLETDVWERAKQRFPMFREMFKSESICSILGNRMSASNTNKANSYAMFTTRGILTKIFNFNVAPAQGKEPDWYDPKFFGYVMWNQILSAINADFSFNCAKLPWFILTKTVNDVQQVVDVICEYKPHMGEVTVEPIQTDFEHACVWQYLMFTDPNMDLEWYVGAVPQRWAPIQNGLSVQNLMLTELGGECLGASQSLEVYSSN